METASDGRAYGRPEPTFIDELTRVGAGTPMGELLRRYWHPIGLARDANATPRKVRVLGEDLILFRDLAGRPGLLDPAACIAGRHCITAASRIAGFVAATTDGCSTRPAIVSSSRVSA